MKMKVIFFSILLLTTPHLSFSQTSKTLKCLSSPQFGFSDDLSLELSENKVIGFVYQSTGNASFSCEVNANRNDKESQWKEEKNQTTVTLKRGGVARIESGKNFYKLTFQELPHSEHCGMGAGISDKIILYKNSKRCRVK